MTYRVGPKGQVVLPKRIREQLGIRPGDEVHVERDGDGVVIRPASGGEDLFGSLPAGATDALAELEAEHRRELESERGA